MISATSSGSFKKTESFLRGLQKLDVMGVLRRNGQKGVEALSSATPVLSGLASTSWYFQVDRQGGGYTISWHNSDVESGFPVAIMLQYGYSTGTGGFVQGEDYINPAIRPIFDQIADDVWKAVKSL